MFYATWTTPCPLAGTLRFPVDPRGRGLGIYEDVDGVRWDIRGILGPYVQARRVTETPAFYSTATNAESGGFHRWEPYEVEVINADVVSRAPTGED